MVLLGGLAPSLDQAKTMVGDALASGRGFERLRSMIAAQGGDARVVDQPNLLPASPKQLLLRATHSGNVAGIHAELVGLATMLLGAGRDRVDDVVDPAVGARVLAAPGETIKAGDPFVEIHYADDARLAEAVVLFNRAWIIDDVPVTEKVLVMESIS
jgi:thymidine phosphorylase